MSKSSELEQLRSAIASIEGKDPARDIPCERPKESRWTKQGREIGELSDSRAAYNKIVALLNAGDKSQRALRERLVRAGYDETAIEDALERARSYGFIDDMRYAGVLIRSRLSQGKGIAGIERELRDNDIDISEVPGWPEEFDADEDLELERALTLLSARPPRSKNIRDGAYRKLVTKGYSSSIAARAARIWSEKSLS